MTDNSKNNKIKETYAATMLKRSNQSCKVFSVKIQKNKLNNTQKELLKMMFVEAKWLYNHILSLSKVGTDVFSMKYTDIKTVTHFSKDKERIDSPLSYLSSQMKQSLLDGMCSSIKGLARMKKNGGKVGSLKFISEYSSLNLKQAHVSYRIVGKSKVKVQGIKKPLKVNGLEQVLSLPEYDLANARLIQRNGDYFIAITVYVPKEQPYNNKPLIGIDLGCQTTVTLSNGKKYNCSVEESEHIKSLKRKASRTKKGSNNRHKLWLKIRKKQQELLDRKNDIARKICHELSAYKVVMQDEQLSSWQKNGHGKAVANGILGRVKAILSDREDTVVLSKWCPTTKLCSVCGKTVSLSQWDRTFVCPVCGESHDRDVHAAENMLWFARNKIGVGRTSTPAEIMDAIRKVFSDMGSLSLKQEAANL